MLRPEVPPGLDCLVGRLLAKDPDDRPATAARVRTGLQTRAEPAVAPVRSGRPLIMFEPEAFRSWDDGDQAGDVLALVLPAREALAFTRLAATGTLNDLR